MPHSYSRLVLTALQVQYPDALPVMMGDLKQIRRFGGLIQKLEINFDFVSAVDELADQVRLEFDFEREARVMDQVADNLKVGCLRLMLAVEVACFQGLVSQSYSWR